MTDKKALFLYIEPSDTAYYIEKKREYALQSRPKLGLMYLASALRDSRGIRSEIWDQTTDHYGVDDVIRAAESGKYLFIGFYSAVSMDKNVIRYIRDVRNGSSARIPILVGGPSFPNAESFLNAGCDIVCNGEGEDTICRIVDHINGLMPIEDVRGISYLKDGKMIKSEPQPLISDIDKIPFPDYSLIDLGNFCDYYIFTMKKPYTTMMTSRGCPFDCVFCNAHDIWGRKYRTRSVENVLAEIDLLVKEHGVRYIAFQDDVFGLDSGWTEEFCGRLKERRYGLNWMCILHPFSFKSDQRKMLGMLKSAGCGLISTGLQSAHPRILRNLNRSPDEPLYLKKLIDAANGLDMLSLTSFIFGSPGETMETIKTSLDYLNTIRPNYAAFYSMILLPGSKLSKEYENERELCGLSKEAIDDMCRIASRDFFLKPGNLVRNGFFVLRHNPGWFVVAAKHALGIMSSIGVGEQK